AWSWRSSATSATNVTTPVPAGAPSRASAAVSASASLETSHVATWHLSAASCRTSSRPIPVPPPVTTATRPEKSCIVASLEAPNRTGSGEHADGDLGGQDAPGGLHDGERPLVEDLDRHVVPRAPRLEARD